MIKQNDSSRPSGSKAIGKTEKRPYTKPAFRFERAFETAALACGKVQMGATCRHFKKVS
jgi:hypothetical protein